MDDDAGIVETAANVDMFCKQARLLKVTYQDFEKMGVVTNQIVDFDISKTKNDADKEKFLGTLPQNIREILSTLQVRLQKHEDILDETIQEIDKMCKADSNVVDNDFFNRKPEVAAIKAALVAVYSQSKPAETAINDALRFHRAGFFYQQMARDRKDLRAKFQKRSADLYQDGVSAYRAKSGVKTTDNFLAGLLLSLAVGQKDISANLSAQKGMIDQASQHREKNVDKTDPNREYLLSVGLIAQAELNISQQQYSNAHRPADDARKKREKNVSPLLLAQINLVRARIFYSTGDATKFIAEAESGLAAMKKMEEYKPLVKDG